MKQFTLRHIPEEIEKIVKKEAGKKGLSLNKTFIFFLELATGFKFKKKKNDTLFHDLDHFFGVWSKEEAKTFKKNLDSQRKIDDGLWKK